MRKTLKGNHGNISRRDFLLKLSASAASLMVLGSCEKSGSESPTEPDQAARPPRQRMSNVFVNNDGMPILVSVTGTAFKKMLTAGLAKLGGLSRLIGAGQNVFIKPNCNERDPYPGITDTNSLLSIIAEVKAVTSGIVSVGDQSAVTSSLVYTFSGMDPAVEAAGARLLTLSNTYRVRNSRWTSNVPDFNVYADIYDSPILISTCVLKRHHTANFTCAIKNNVGAVAGPGVSATRNYLHYQSGDFMGTVGEIAGVVNPDLNIVDARQVLTVGGPRAEEGVAVEAHKIILCGDIVATDAFCVRILAAHDPGFSVEMASATLNHAQSLGLGTADLSRVQVEEIDS